MSSYSNYCVKLQFLTIVAISSLATINPTLNKESGSTRVAAAFPMDPGVQNLRRQMGEYTMALTHMLQCHTTITTTG